MASIEYSQKIFLTILPLLLFSVSQYHFATSSSNDAAISNLDNPYKHQRYLDPERKFLFEWLVDWENSCIIFNVTVETLGWFGFVVNNSGYMRGEDLIFAGVFPNGTWYFHDVLIMGGHTPDKDWIVLAASENGTHTIFSFSRDFYPDSKNINITDDGTMIMWAFGKTDLLEYHHEHRGVLTLYLRDPDLTPEFVKEAERNSVNLPGFSELNDEVLQIWSIKDKFQIPKQKTTYWCQIHKLSLPKKHHIIGYKLFINPEARPSLRQLILFRCNVLNGVNPSVIYDPFVKYPGEECYNQNQPLWKIPTQFCVEIKVVYSIGGGESAFFPKHFGIPVGETNSNEYFLLQAHYDNSNEVANITADIQLDVYYTEIIRTNDGGILNIGHNTPGSPSILIPPGEERHRLYGHCGATCTKSMLPPEGIKIIGAVLQTHSSGKRIRVQQFRNGTELPWIFNDDSYDPLYQPLRLRREEVLVLPGDQLSVQCYYETTKRNKTTVGGYARDQETCSSFIIYYNRLKDYHHCKSEIVSPEYMKRYLAGTMRITWDQSVMEYRSTAATTTPQVVGMTISEISDSRFVNWTTSMRSRLQRDHVTESHIQISSSTKYPFSSLMLPREYVSFPVEATPYEPPRHWS